MIPTATVLIGSSKTTTKVIHECFGKQISVHLSTTPRDVNAKYLRRLILDPKDLHSLSGADNDFVLFHWFFGVQFRFHMLRPTITAWFFLLRLRRVSSSSVARSAAKTRSTHSLDKKESRNFSRRLRRFSVFTVLLLFSYAIRSSRVALQAPLNNIKETRTPNISYSFSKHSESDRSQLKNIEQAFLLEEKN